MSAAMTAILNTQYDGTGFTSASSGMDNLQQKMSDTADAADNSSSKFDSFSRRIERPISFLAIQGLSQEMTDVGNKGETTSQMLEKGLHAAALAISFFNPEMGLLVVGALAAYEVFRKLNAQKTAEEFQKEADALVAEHKELENLVPLLIIKSDIQKGTKEALNQELEASKQSTEAFKKNYEAAENNVVIRGKMIDSLKEQIKTNLGLTDSQLQATISQSKWSDAIAGDELSQQKANTQLKELNELTKKQTQDQNFLTGSTKAYLELAKESNDTKTDEELMKKKHDLQMQAYVDNLNLSQATKQLKSDESLLAKNEAAILSTNDPKELAFFEEKEDWLKKLIKLESQQVDDLKSGSDSQMNILGNLKNAYTGTFKTIVSETQKGGKDMGQIMKDALSTMVKDFANAQAGQLEMLAIKDAFINPGLALAELAGATAIAAAGSALSGVIGGNSSAASSTPSISSPSTSSLSSSSSQSGVPGTNLTIMFQGNDPLSSSFFAQMLQKQNTFVQSNNGMIVSTHSVNHRGQVVQFGN